MKFSFSVFLLSTNMRFKIVESTPVYYNNNDNNNYNFID